VLFAAKRAGKNTIRTTADLLGLPLESSP
jgi:hypothetical protein